MSVQQVESESYEAIGLAVFIGLAILLVYAYLKLKNFQLPDFAKLIADALAALQKFFANLLPSSASGVDPYGNPLTSSPGSMPGGGAAQVFTGAVAGVDGSVWDQTDIADYTDAVNSGGSQ
jgi:hypothetical protein